MDDYHSYRFKHYRMPQPEQWNGSLPQSPQAIKRFVQENVNRYFRRGKNDFEPWPYGGVTLCSVFVGDKFVGSGEAVCSMTDHFNYKRGVQIAKGRALKSLSQTER